MRPDDSWDNFYAMPMYEQRQNWKPCASMPPSRTDTNVIVTVCSVPNAAAEFITAQQQEGTRTSEIMYVR